MGQTIFKYPLRVTDQQDVLIPVGAKLLSVGVQTDNETGGPTLVMWALVDTEAPKSFIVVQIFGTGNPIPDGKYERAYLGTFQMPEYAFVGHVFYLI